MKIFDVDPVEFWKILTKVRDSKAVSERALSRSIGKSGPYLANMRRNGVIPPLEVRLSISRILKRDLTFRYAVPIQMEQEQRSDSDLTKWPELTSIIRWLREENLNVNLTHDYANYIELFQLPTRGRRYPVPTFLGSKSLTAQSLGIDSTDQLRDIYLVTPIEITKNVLRRHRIAMDGLPLVSYRTVTHEPSIGQATTIEYIQLLHLVHEGESRSPRILNFSTPL